MNSVLRIVFMIFIVVSSRAQTKILFDATKAETANNADWIIDADQFNLGYNTTAYIGGDEANAQQIPTPAQSGITATTSQEYWTGALSAWAVDAVKQGYEVETLPYYASITYGDVNNVQDLSNYNIFVVCEPNILFTNSEKTALINFVQNGGGLFMIADHNNSDRNGDGYDSPDIWNDLLQNNDIQDNPFGILFDYEYFTEATTNVVNTDAPLIQGVFGEVTSVEFYGGTTMTIDTNQNPTAKGVVYRTAYTNTGSTGVMCAYASYGDGRVVALGDSSPADDGTGDDGDNLYDGWIEDANGNHERLIMNATIWLAEAGTVGIPNFNSFDKNIQLYTFENTCYFNAETGNNEVFSLVLFDNLGRKIDVREQLNSLETYSFQIPNYKGILYYHIVSNTQVVKRGKLFIN